MQSTATLVLSAYRGQAKAGIGEGPDSPIAHGEQYLEGTAPALAQDSELLQAIRPWLSLDSDPADHQRLKDQLESWSCFCYREWLFVVRLMSAGTYDRRAAYFSHARAWRLADCREDFDPGAYLGCARVFDTPQALSQSEAALESLRPAALPAQWLARLQPEAPVAERYLGHLLQALEQGYPLLIAVPVREFTAGEPLHTLVSFARAALPADLKYRCAIRLYTRQPERFSRHLQANLIAVPDDSAGDALSAQRNATLLDRQGEVKAGQPLEQRAAAYAQAVMEGALKSPRGLLLFSARFGPRHAAGLPVGDDVRPVQISYNLALALAGAEADRDYVFRHYLRAQARNAADLPWKQLLDEQDWRLFPRQTLCDFVLQHSDELTASEQVLQNAVIEALGRLGLTLDEWLPAWWQADDPLKLSRLLQLLAQAPSLLSPAAAAERTMPIPLARLKAFTPLHGLLQAEFKAGVLGRRSQESEVLAELAADPDNCRILAAATKAGQLDPTWAHIHINTVDAEALPDAARYLVKNPQDWPCWGKASKRVLDRLRERGSIPDDLARSIRQLGQTLDFLEHWEIYIRLADLLAPADPQSGAIAPGNSLMQRLWQNLGRLDSPKTHAHLVGIALDEQNWHCLAPASLVLPNGEPALPWADEVAERLLSSAAVRERLNTAALLKLLRAAGQRLDKEQIQQVYATVTARMRRDSAGTTRALIQWGAWFGWRRQAESELTPSECRTAALAWLHWPLWQDSNAPEVTLETWKQVLDDLQPWLSDLEIQQLRGGEDSQGPSLWPWIKPFEADQFTGLCRLANDFGALAELVEAVSVNSSSENIINNIRLAYQQSHLVDSELSFPGDALLWLIKDTRKDEDAEKHFKSFRENYSTWFPADFEPIMLNLLRQPGLDLRVARLEEKLEEKANEKPVPVVAASDDVGIPKQDNQPPPRKKLISTAMILPALTALILAGILAAGSIYGYNNLMNNNTKLLTDITTLKASVESLKTSKPSVTAGVSVTSPPITGPVTEPSSNPPAEDLSSAINGLLVLLSKQQGNNPAINTLWNVHFSNIQNAGNLDQNTVLGLFQKKDFLWGMIKLPAAMALITGKNIKDTRFLENVNAITPTGEVYSLILDPKHQNSIKSDTETRDMLAFLICRVQEIENDPKLKVATTVNFFKQAATIFKPDSPCTSLQSKDNAVPGIVLPGIIKLKSDLENLSTAPGQPG